MATRKPLVLISGTMQELPAGDLVTGAGTFPFFDSTGAAKNIALTAANALPFFTSAGAANNISLV